MPSPKAILVPSGDWVRQGDHLLQDRDPKQLLYWGMQNKVIGLDGSDMQTCVASLADGIEINHPDAALDSRTVETRTWEIEVRKSHIRLQWSGWDFCLNSRVGRYRASS